MHSNWVTDVEKCTLRARLETTSEQDSDDNGNAESNDLPVKLPELKSETNMGLFLEASWGDSWFGCTRAALYLHRRLVLRSAAQLLLPELSRVRWSPFDPVRPLFDGMLVSRQGLPPRGETSS